MRGRCAGGPGENEVALRFAGGVEVTITARRFLGRVDRLRVKVPGIEQDLHARLRDARAFRSGQVVRLAVNERDVLVFPQRNHDKDSADA